MPIFGRANNNANQKLFTFVFRCTCKPPDKSKTTIGEQYDIFIQSATDQQCDINEAENWQTAVQFLHTKLVYEAFAQSHAKVPFPLPSLEMQSKWQQQERSLPLRSMLGEMKSLSPYVQPKPNLDGTFALFNVHSTSTLGHYNPAQIDYLNRLAKGSPMQAYQSGSQKALNRSKIKQKDRKE